MAQAKKDDQARGGGRDSTRLPGAAPRRGTVNETDRRRERARLLRAANRSRRMKTR
ncbi:MAG: hypothetical protein NDJ90_11185 [Oligoflexia bacterium]|nr:hypothetical protein [Oligoflexia bacterium]